MSENGGGGETMMVAMLGLVGCVGMCICACVLYYFYSTGTFGDIFGTVAPGAAASGAAASGTTATCDHKEKLSGFEYTLRKEDPATKLMACPSGWEENYCFLDVDGAESGLLQCRRTKTSSTSQTKKKCVSPNIWDGKKCRLPKGASSLPKDCACPEGYAVVSKEPRSCDKITLLQRGRDKDSCLGAGTCYMKTKKTSTNPLSPWIHKFANPTGTGCQ